MVHEQYQDMREHPEVKSWISNPKYIFVADGSDMLSNANRAVALIARVPDGQREPGEDRFHAAIEDLDSDAGDAWYPIIENLDPDSDIGDLKQVFKEGYAYGYGEVFKDPYDLDVYNQSPYKDVSFGGRERAWPKSESDKMDMIMKELSDIKNLLKRYIEKKSKT